MSLFDVASSGPSTVDVARSDRLSRLSFRRQQKSEVGSTENREANLCPAYPHRSNVDYYSCANHCWLRGVVLVDVVDQDLVGCPRVSQIVYSVRLHRTHQFRNHVPLRHMRSSPRMGRLVVVRTGANTTWQVATIKKIMMDATDCLYLLEVQGKEVVLAASSVRRCLPAQSEVSSERVCRILGGFSIV